MIENLICLSGTAVVPDESAGLGDSEVVITLPVQLTIVAVSIAPSADDAGLTMDIQDDGTDIITAIDGSDQDAPGEWLTPGFGGTNAPVTVARGSDLSLDFNNAANGTAVNYQIWGLAGVA